MEIYGVRGEHVRVVSPTSLHHGKDGWVTGRHGGTGHVRVRFSPSRNDFGYFDRSELVPASVAVQVIQYTGTTTWNEAVHKAEIQRALVGDCTPTEWKPKALDVFLSLIGNCQDD